MYPPETVYTSPAERQSSRCEWPSGLGQDGRTSSASGESRAQPDADGSNHHYRLGVKRSLLTAGGNKPTMHAQASVCKSSVPPSRLPLPSTPTFRMFRSSNSVCLHPRESTKHTLLGTLSMLLRRWEQECVTLNGVPDAYTSGLRLARGGLSQLRYAVRCVTRCVTFSLAR